MSVITWTVVLLAGLSYTLADLGNQVTIEDYPSLVQVEKYADTVWLQQCVGSIITNYHILSTAGCFSDALPNTSRIRAGATKRGIDGVVREVLRVHKHPNYGLLDNDADIAVIRLVSSLTWSATIQQGSILGEGIYLPEGLDVKLLGWGKTAGGNDTENDLSSLDLYTKNEEKCLLKYLESDKPQTVTENMICVGVRGYEGRDLDATDIGAPLVYQATVVGVVSFGVPNGDDEFPIVSTAVGSYSQWIIETAV